MSLAKTSNTRSPTISKSSRPMPSDSDSLIEAVRHFSRFYTQRLKVLDEHLLSGPFNLPEARVVFELAHRSDSASDDADALPAQANAALLAERLEMDPSYLSRLLRSLEARGYLSRKRSVADGREVALSLTAKGRRAAQRNEQLSRLQVADLLKSVSVAQQDRLRQALKTIESTLSPAPVDDDALVLPTTDPIVLRAPEAGDFGWVIQAHGRLYAREYQWDERFEAMVAKITGDFIENFQPQWERCWIAELNGRNVGSVFVVRQSRLVAKLRLLVLEPEARGRGIGRQLVEQVIRFASQKGYQELVLWTNKNLTAAISLYLSLGFELQSEQPHESFGHHLVGQNYRLTLQAG